MLRILSLFLAITTLFSCSSARHSQSSGRLPKGWISLFDGQSTAGWHSYGSTTAGAAWKAQDGTLYLDNSYKKDKSSTVKGGDLVTDLSFDNFHLKLEWKISKNGNSGIIYHVQDDKPKYEYVWFTGPEMQILDNEGHSDGKKPNHRAGSLYDMIAGTEGIVKQPEEWNLAEIICDHGKLELRLNNVTVVSTTYGDDNWKKLIAESKFKNQPNFGKIFEGHIALQDHGNDVWFRNIMVKRL
jgi:hypothetical protein